MGILRRWFGPSREEIWRKLSTELGATYVPGGFWKGDQVQVSHEHWTITLDTFTVSTGKSTIIYTRLRAPYVNPDGFRFTIYRHGMFSELGKMLGMQDVEIGQPDFDAAYIIKGTNPDKLRSLFGDAKLRELVAAQPDVYLTVRADEGLFAVKFPVGTDELCFQVCGVIVDEQRLKLLFDLFAETLDQLCRMGAAYEDPPNVAL